MKGRVFLNFKVMTNIENIENINITINSSNHREDFIQDLASFNLINKTPIECMRFLNELMFKYVER